MMKHKFLLGVLIACGLSAFSQRNVRLFGYMQENSPGTVKTGTDENGRTLEQNKMHPDYYLYVSAPSKDHIQPMVIWINGKPYSVKTIATPKSPVVIQVNKKPVTLVPGTTNSVRQISLIPYASSNKFTAAQKKSHDNEMVVVYKMNGKFYSATLKKLTRLEPELNE